MNIYLPATASIPALVGEVTRTRYIQPGDTRVSIKLAGRPGAAYRLDDMGYTHIDGVPYYEFDLGDLTEAQALRVIALCQERGMPLITPYRNHIMRVANIVRFS